MKFASKLAFDITEHNQVPDAVIRHGALFLIKQHIKKMQSIDVELLTKIHTKLIERLNESSRVFLLDKANEQYYEIPHVF